MNERKAPKEKTRYVAYNPLRKRWEVVYPEDELGNSRTIKQYWSGSLGWVTIPGAS